MTEKAQTLAWLQLTTHNYYWSYQSGKRFRRWHQWACKGLPRNLDARCCLEKLNEWVTRGLGIALGLPEIFSTIIYSNWLFSCNCSALYSSTVLVCIIWQISVVVVWPLSNRISYTVLHLRWWDTFKWKNKTKLILNMIGFSWLSQ